MKKSFFNLKIDVLDTGEVLSKCNDFFLSEKPNTIFFLNAHCFNIAQKTPEYFTSLLNTDLLLNDGIGIKLASHLTKIRFKENLNGTDLIPQILDLAAQLDKKAFFLGGKDGIAEKAALHTTKSKQGLDIVGYHSGYFDSEQEMEIIEKINESYADLLILGMGVPKQEIWAKEKKTILKNVKIIIAGGAILDFLSGEVKRAPLWLRKINMEWLYRLYLEPKRMWKRYLLGNIKFFYYVMKLA